MIRAVLLAAALLAVVPVAADGDPRLARSREVAQQLQAALLGRLQPALASGGPVAAIAACRDDAPLLATEVATAAGARVGRTALRVRNPANAPDAEARAALEGFAAELALVPLAERAAAAPERFVARPDGSARYLKAIVTQPPCLACHGAALAPEVAAAVAAAYPADRATGFAVGDLRGAILIDWPAPGGGR